MDSKRAWVVYSVVRVLAFALPFVIVMIGFPTWSLNWVVGAVLGTVIGLAVSYIFLRRERMGIGQSIADARARRDQRSQLEKEEDEALDAEEPADRSVAESDVDAAPGIQTEGAAEHAESALDDETATSDDATTRE